MILFFLILPNLSCSKSNPIAPTDGSNSNLLLLRQAIWTEGDHTIAAQAARERQVDVSNVILGREYMGYDPLDPPEEWTNGKRGYVLTHEDNIPSEQSPMELTVVTWAQMTTIGYGGEQYNYWDVKLKVLSYDENGALTESGVETVPNPEWDPVGGGGTIPAIQNCPCVTAHIGDANPDDYQITSPPLLVIDVAYQRGHCWEAEQRWQVNHVQYTMDLSNFGTFNLVTGPNRIAPSDPWTYDAIHPDIVIGTYWKVDGPYGPPGHEYYVFYDIDKLMVAFEQIERSTGSGAIVYGENIPRHTDIYPWMFQATSSVQQVGEIPQYPRIDAGIDCSYPFMANPVFYIAAVVWHSLIDKGDYITSILYYNYKPFNVPKLGLAFQQIPTPFDSFDTTHAPNGLPYVEVDPIENFLEGYCPENYTHMVWSRFMNVEGTDIEPWYTNSQLVMQHIGHPEEAIYPVADGGDIREGLTTVSTYSDQNDQGYYDTVGTIQYISYIGEEDNNQIYPVFSVDFYYYYSDPEHPGFADREQVSDDGNQSSDEFPWDCGPTSAMIGGDLTFCAWTRKGFNPISYDILSDRDL